MIKRTDYRKSPSGSPEGSSRARRRRQKFLDDLPLDVIEDAYRTDKSPTPVGQLDPDVRDEIARIVRDESELLGFWLAWHRSGGFSALENAGWHRATIFRKVRAFRDHFDTHPDDYQPDWIKLNLTKVWTADIKRRLTDDPDRDYEPDGLET